MAEKIVTEKLRKNMYEYAKAERFKFKQIFDTMDEYVKNNNLFISNPYRISGIESSEEYLDYCYVIYCTRPLEHANRITNLLYEAMIDHPLIGTLMMNTAVKNEEFSISYDNRFIAKIFSVQRERPKGKTLELSSLIEAKIINKIPYLPAEIEIIDIYQKLYATGFESYQQFVNKMLTQVLTKVGGEVQEITGGAEQPLTCYERKREELEAIKVAIVKDFLVNRTDLALLGGLAVEWINSDTDICPKFDRLQLVGTIPAEQLVAEITSYINSLGRKYEISAGEELDLLIPKDFRTKRSILSMSIRTDMGIKEKPFLDYFNSCEFEIIPVQIHANVQIVNKYVLLRFFFIDLWVNKFIYSIGKLDKESYVARQERAMELIKITKDSAFVVDGFLGTFYDYEISKKEKRLEQEKFFGPYTPAMYFNQNKKLRIL